MRAIEEHQAADQSYMEQGVQLLELARRAPALFAKQAPREKRRLLNFLLSNCTCKEGELRVTFRQPFDLIAAAVALPERQKAAGVTPDGLRLDWLPFVELCRTLCPASPPDVKAVFEGLRHLALATDEVAIAARAVRLETSSCRSPSRFFSRSASKSRLAEVQRRIERAVQMVLAGAEDVPSLRAVLVGLDRERLRLEAQLAGAKEPQSDLGTLDSMVGAILAELEDIRSVLLHGEPEQRRERFLAGIRIEQPTRQAVLSWYDLPRQLLPLCHSGGAEGSRVRWCPRRNARAANSTMGAESPMTAARHRQPLAERTSPTFGL